MKIHCKHLLIILAISWSFLLVPGSRANSWPSMDVDFSDAGTGVIGEVVREIWMNSDRNIAKSVQHRIYRDRNLAVEVTKDEIEHLGAKCDAPPSQLCRAHGVVTYVLHGLPQENKRHGVRTVNIDILIDASQSPIKISVEKSEIDGER